MNKLLSYLFFSTLLVTVSSCSKDEVSGQGSGKDDPTETNSLTPPNWIIGKWGGKLDNILPFVVEATKDNLIITVNTGVAVTTDLSHQAKSHIYVVKELIKTDTEYKVTSSTGHSSGTIITQSFRFTKVSDSQIIYYYMEGITDTPATITMNSIQ